MPTTHARPLTLPFACPQAHQNPAGNWSEWMLAKLRLPNMMYEEVPHKPLDYYTCPFKASKIDK